MGHTAPVLAAILTIGNEVVCGDVQNTNATWLAQRLESLGVRIVLTASVPDEIEAIAEFIRRERDRVDHLIVTGGLGGTPDDITREALAAAFDVKQAEVPDLAAELRARFPKHPDYAARWALLPVGSRPLSNPHGGAPGFVIENVWVLPGPPDRDGGDVRPLRRGAPRRAADLVVAARLPDARERDRQRPRWRDRPLAAGPDRLVPALPPGRPRGRDRAQVGESGEARRSRRLARAEPRGRDCERTPRPDGLRQNQTVPGRDWAA